MRQNCALKTHAKWQLPKNDGQFCPVSLASKDDTRSRLVCRASLFVRGPDQHIALLRQSWPSGDDIAPMAGKPSAIDLPFADPFLCVTGLKGCSRADVKLVFSPSETKLDLIASESWRVRLRPSLQVVARIGNVADPHHERLILVGVIVMIGGVIGAAQWLL